MKEEECMSQFETITAQVGERKLSFEQASHCLTALFRQNSEDSDPATSALTCLIFLGSVRN
jgi:hypothetical protein